MVEIVGSYASSVSSSQDRAERAAPSREAGSPKVNVADDVNVRMETSIGKTVLEVVDPSTGNVIRQIPTPAAIALQELQNELLAPDYDYAPDVDAVVSALTSGQINVLADEGFDPFLQELLDEKRQSLEAAREYQVQLAAFYTSGEADVFSGSVVNKEA